MFGNVTIFHALSLVGFVLGFIALYYADKAASFGDVLRGIHANSYPDKNILPSDFRPMRDVHEAAGWALGHEFMAGVRPCPDRRGAVNAYRRGQLSAAQAVGGLDFKHACLWLSQGLSVRRSRWADGVFVAFTPRGAGIINTELRIFGPGRSPEGDPFCPAGADVDFTDWFPMDDAEVSS